MRKIVSNKPNSRQAEAHPIPEWLLTALQHHTDTGKLDKDILTNWNSESTSRLRKHLTVLARLIGDNPTEQQAMMDNLDRTIKNQLTTNFWDSDDEEELSKTLSLKELESICRDLCSVYLIKTNDQAVKAELTQEYKAKTEAAVTEALARLSEGALPDATDILDLLAWHRREIAFDQYYGTDPEDFGISRADIGDRYTTPLTADHLRPYISTVETFIETNPDTLEKIRSQLPPALEDDPRYSHVIEKAASVTAVLDGQPVELTTFLKASEYLEKSEFERIFGGEPEVLVAILHTKRQHIPAILKHVNRLYEEFKKSEFKTVADLSAAIGRMHWWLAQAVRYKRGSAAIIEMFAKTLFARHGVTIEWNPKVKSDMEALLSKTPEEFILKYPLCYGVS